MCICIFKCSVYDIHPVYDILGNVLTYFCQLGWTERLQSVLSRSMLLHSVPVYIYYSFLSVLFSVIPLPPLCSSYHPRSVLFLFTSISIYIVIFISVLLFCLYRSYLIYICSVYMSILLDCIFILCLSLLLSSISVYAINFFLCLYSPVQNQSIVILSILM